MKKFFLCHWREWLLVLLLSAGSLYWLSWHWRPFTQNAFVFANTRPVSPLVEGFITEIHVRNNQFVRKGDPLFTVFREPYRLRAAEQENELRAKRAELLAMQSEIRSLEAEIRWKQADLANDRYLSNRAGRMYRAEAVSQAYSEERRRAEQASGVTDGALRAANVFILRVPEGVDAGGKRWAEPADYRAAADAGGLWTLQKGDVIVRGAAAADGQTPAALRERYGPENVLTVLGVADNRRGTRGRHWRVTGE